MCSACVKGNSDIGGPYDREDVSLRVPSSSTRKNVASAQSLSLIAAVLLIRGIAQVNK